MIEAPLYRNLPGTAVPAAELFSNGGLPQRALVICADTEGYVDLKGANDSLLKLRRLPALQRECTMVADVFRGATRGLPASEVRVLGAPGSPPVTMASLRASLSSDWDVIHFGGHSYYERVGSGDGRGYLFGGAPDSPEAIPIEAVAPYLKRSRLLYLSSCQSASATFAAEAAKAGIPVVGFRWPVEDRFAAIHARLFYRKLFRRRSVETALWSTQRALHRHLELNNTWAASILVMGPQ
jgi:CHAT domain-containing protein